MTRNTEWRKGVWQFVEEHSRPVKDGYVAFFGYTNKANFWERVKSRSNDSYHRDMEAWKIKWEGQQIKERRMERREHKLLQLKTSHPIRYRLVVLLRQTANNMIQSV